MVASLAPVAVAAARRISFNRAAQPALITADADAVSDALQNTLENVLLHSPVTTEVLVAVVTQSVVLGAGIRVSDHGPGIEPADRARVFERFWRKPGTTVQGAGLGRAITRGVTEAQGEASPLRSRPEEERR